MKEDVPSQAERRSTRRRTVIDIARRRQRPGAGTAGAVLSLRSVRMRWPDLTDVLGRLPWAVVGAAATRLYIPERSTHDLDVAVLAKDAEAARERLQHSRLPVSGRPGRRKLVLGSPGWHIRGRR